MDNEKIARELVKLADTLMVDYENNAEEWWESGGRELWEDIAGRKDQVEVSSSKADRFLDKAERIPGWDDGPSYAPTAIIHTAKQKKIAKKSGTFKCPNCGSKVLENTGYCLKCKKKVKKAMTMDNEKIARELVKLAKEIVGQTLADYEGDDEELADDLEGELRGQFGGSSDVNDAEILFYEEETYSGEPVQIRVLVNPRNQPSRSGKIKIGLVIEGEYGAPTYEDGIWEFEDRKTVRDIAKTIERAASKVLRKW